MVGALISPARSEPTDTSAPVEPSPKGVERRAINEEPAQTVDGTIFPRSTPDSTRVAPWRRWPRLPGNEADDGRTGDGGLFYGPDGRLCWPHGDHVHCQ